MTTAVGAESTVQAIVCHDPATLSITQPASDTVVVDPTTTLSGDVSQATQIEVAVDGQFNGVIPLDAAAVTFSAPLQLAPGTHTISLTAVDACQIGNATDTIVITYQPVIVAGTPQSVGSETPTSLPSASGVVIGDGAAVGQVTTDAPTVVERLLAPMVNLGRNLDIIPPNATKASTSLTPPLLRIILLIVGFGIIMLSARLAALFGGATSLLGAHPQRVRRTLFIAIGGGLMALAFLLA